MEGKSGNRSKRAAIIAGVVCALALAGVGVMLWHPWEAGVAAGDGTALAGQDAGAGNGASQDGGAMEADPAYWVVGLFRDLSPMVGSGRFDAWSEVGGDEPHDFSVVLSQSGQSAHFAFSEDYLEMAASAGVEPTVEAFVQDMNGRTSSYAGGDLFEAAGEGAGNFSLVGQGGGEGTAYVAGDALREFAQAASRQAASYEAARAAEEDEAAVGDDGLTDSEREWLVVTPEGGKAIKGELLVFFNEGVIEGRMREIVAEQGCTWPEDQPETGGSNGIVVGTPEGVAEWDMESVFDGYSEVWYATLNRPIQYDQTAASSSIGQATSQNPESREGDDAQALASWDSYLQYYLRYSGFDNAWERSRCNGAVTIGVIDSGVDYENTEIAANIDIAHMRNEVDNVTGPSADMTDRYLKDDGTSVTHGTHVIAVASAIAGDDYGCDGASYNATVIPVKDNGSDGKGSLQDVLDSYRYLIDLDDPPEVISMSFSFGYESKEQGDVAMEKFQALVNLAWSKDIVTVASAGNDGDAANLYSYPACLEHVVSVGALDAPPWFADEDSYVPTLASFSNTNSDVDMAAYGVNIHTVNAYADFPDWYVSMNGTSFSAPQVAAAAALVKAQNPSWEASDVETRLISTARRIAGYGSIGALDAAAAVGWTPPDLYNPTYVSNDATNIWTQIYTMGKLAEAADGLKSGA